MIDYIILAERLREYSYSNPMCGEASDVIKAQAERIAELEAEDRGLRAAVAAVFDRAERAEVHLANILDLLLGDGGQYRKEHGVERAMSEATELWSAMVVRVGKAEKIEADIAVAREALLAFMDLCQHTDNIGTCCCGSPVDAHGFDDGHSPVDAWDYALMQTEDHHATAIAAARGEQPIAEYLDANGAALAALVETDEPVKDETK